MSRLQAFAFASCIGLTGTALAPVLHADEWNKKTVLTVNESIQVPSKTLAPGKYVIKLLDSPSNRHIVQIFDENEQHLIVTALAIPNYRLQPTGESQFGFWEVPAGQPKALRSWFYPGDNFGQEFAYPKDEAAQIAANSGQSVPTTDAQSDADLATARVGTVDKAGTESVTEEHASASTSAPAPAPAPAAAAPPTPQEQTPVDTAQNTADRAAAPPPDPAPTPEPAPPVAASPAPEGTAPPQQSSLPATASPYPSVALLGLAALAGFGVLKFAVKRS